VDSVIAPPNSSKLDPLVGRVVNGQFELIELVASGGMGKIYRAEQLALCRQVAVKFLRSLDTSGEEDLKYEKRFFREASILARLQHPNIVTVFDYGVMLDEDDERVFIAMEFLAGRTLRQRLSKEGRLSEIETIGIARQIARGLGEAHAHGVVHRDLKPSNVMLVRGRDPEDVVKLIDFGILKYVGSDAGDAEDITQAGSLVGSPRYAAPEVLRGTEVDARTDVYSLGLLLYECLTGAAPFEGATPMEILTSQMSNAPVPMRGSAPDLRVSGWLEDLVMSCIEREPERRPQTMRDVERSLAEGEAGFAAGRAPSSLRVPTPPATSAQSRGEHAGRALTGETVRPRSLSGVVASSMSARQLLRPDGYRVMRFLVPSVGAFVAGFAAVLFLRNSAPAPVATASVLPAVAAPPPPAASAAQSEFSIDSMPSGAQVTEGDRVLGVTPIQITIDNAQAKIAPRSFILSLDGYQSYSFTQGPDASSMRLVVVLSAATDTSAKRDKTIPHARRWAAPKTHAPATRSTRDARLGR
jgi:serine/threonine protein kinase